jgi:hypothetical protein
MLTTIFITTIKIVVKIPDRYLITLTGNNFSVRGGVGDRGTADPKYEISMFFFFIPWSDLVLFGIWELFGMKGCSWLTYPELLLIGMEGSCSPLNYCT